MRKYKSVSKEVEEEYSVICNACGMELNSDEFPLEEWQAEKIRKMKIAFGYGDPADGMSFDFDVCDTCMHKWMDSFTIPPEESFWNELL
jgi:hypothetical protein